MHSLWSRDLNSTGLVLTERLVEAGMTLAAEAQRFAKDDLTRARGARNGLMIALLALCPVRLRKYSALQVGRTLKEILIVIGPNQKSVRSNQKAIPSVMIAGV